VSGSKRVIAMDVAGLTPRLLAHMPRLSSALSSHATLGAVLPAVTCSAQATFLTGLSPTEHGIVANGWYFRDQGEVLFWRQHNALVEGRKLWDHLREHDPEFTVANICWWYAMGADTDWTVTPRPVYHADGRKDQDCYTRPPELHDELEERFGVFPLFRYWGPLAGIESTRWIVSAATHVFAAKSPDLTLVYLPHLDYDLQRFGPDSPEAARAAIALDAEIEPLLAAGQAAGAVMVALSEYGITAVDHPVDINRRLREAGFLEVYEQAGMEYLDPWMSRAFAVSDHQIAHVYVRDDDELDAVRAVLEATPGVEHVLGRADLAAHGLDHERSGELVVLAAPRAWFTYYYWTDDDRAPDFARIVEIHRKPGYDPAELLFDPHDRLVKLRAASALVRKKIGLRYTMRVVALEADDIRGSHGLLPRSAADGPVLLCSEPLGKDIYRADEVMGVLAGLLTGGDVTVSRSGDRA